MHTATTPARYNFSAIMLDAWRIAHRAEKRFGTPAREFLSIAMRQAWARAKATKLATYRQVKTPTTVYFLCVDETTSYNTRAINLPAVDQVYTEKQDAEAALALLQQAFNRPYIKTSPYYHMH